MRFVAQDLSSGATSLIEAPAPVAPPQGIVVRSVASLVSAGTERMLVDFGQANLLQKARQQPDRVRDVVDKARTEGLAQTVDAVRSKLAQPVPLGYANAGVVVEVGARVRGFSVGQLVASNGAHAELVSVPVTLAAPVPQGVGPDQACFAPVVAVGLEGIRLAAPTIGERFAVSGLGLIGLLTVQLLRAQGCSVLGIDPDPSRRQLAEQFGAQTSEPGGSAEGAAGEFSRHRGVDGVLVCASTKSSDPVRSAARMCRARGRIVLVGVTGLELDRSEFYEKEISFQVSCSYGAGRYEAGYEAGNDYPFGHVRWTAGRNLEAALDLMSTGAIDVAPLITHRFAFAEVTAAYRALVEESPLGIVLDYPEPDGASTNPVLRRFTAPAVTYSPTKGTKGGIAVIGAGNFATRVLVPAIKEAGGRISVIGGRSGVSAAFLADREGAPATSDLESIFDDPSIASVFVATRHDSHADLAERAIRAGKHVYVEKPLALTADQIEQVVEAIEQVSAERGTSPVLMVGFNRRFAPLTLRMRALLDEISEPKGVIITVNAGHIPADHWTHDPVIGGGRILGEACHFIDLARCLVGHPIEDVRTRFLRASPTRDSATISLGFSDGSTAEIHYLANGAKRFPKERVEVFTQGRVLQNDNFRKLRAFGWPGQHTVWLRQQDKGHRGSVRAFLSAATETAVPPVPLEDLIEVSRAAVTAAGTAPFGEPCE